MTGIHWSVPTPGSGILIAGAWLYAGSPSFTVERAMSDNKEKMMPASIFRGDPRVRALMGRQKPPIDGEGIRRSCFAFCMYDGGEYLVFHTMTRRLLALPPQYIDYFIEGKVFPLSVLEHPAAAKLYEDHFLVPENTQESRVYLELKDILVLKEELPRAVSRYVILPTTACNARCFYCFEQGMRYRTMTPDTVSDTLRFIREHSPKGKKIHIHWFGGEPLCAPDNIDRITDGLEAAGIAFTAEMTSNGSLFTEETVKKAKEKWKVGKVQVTLDGMADEYARRKRYASGPEKPFETVMRNMHMIIAEGINVSVRLNADEDNLGEIFRTVDYLCGEFDGEERKRVSVYAHSLYGGTGEAPGACPAGAGSDALEERVLEINDYIQQRGLSVWDLGGLFDFKTHFCMAAAPECNIVIDAEGGLFLCEAMPESFRIGDVKKGIDPDAFRQATAPCEVRTECGQCVFLPVCTEFDRCPNRMTWDSCFRQEKRNLERDLRFMHNLYQDQKRRAASDGAAGQEVRAGVSD